MGKSDIVSVLARELLGLSPGNWSLEHLGKYGDLAGGFSYLRDSGAVEGSLKGVDLKLTKLNIPVLWEYGGLGTILAVIPLPFSKRFEGMATGLHKAFRDAGIPFSLGFIRGATKRVDALLAGRCDLIMISKMAARLDMEKGIPISLIHEFRPKTYAKEHVVVFRDPKARRITSGMRVALDPVSIDQTILTSYECEGLDVEFVETPYAQTFNKIRDNQLDAAIWTLDEMEERSIGYHVRPLMDSSPRRVAAEDTMAVLVTSRQQSVLGGILQNLVDFDGVEKTQAQVLKQEVKPSY